jgi:serine/threonine protein kinase
VGSSRLRLHTDCDQEEGVLVFPYFKSTLLALIQGNPEFPTEGRKKILRQVGEAIQELHNKDWIHLGIIPSLERYYMDMLGADIHILQTSNPTTS